MRRPFAPTGGAGSGHMEVITMAQPLIEQAGGPETASPGGVVPPGAGVVPGSPSETAFGEFVTLYRRFFAASDYGATVERAVARDIEDAYGYWMGRLGRDVAERLKLAARWAVAP